MESGGLFLFGFDDFIDALSVGGDDESQQEYG